MAEEVEWYICLGCKSAYLKNTLSDQHHFPDTCDMVCPACNNVGFYTTMRKFIDDNHEFCRKATNVQ